MRGYLKEAAGTAGDAALQGHLELTSAVGAGPWLHALPNPAFRQDVDPGLFKVMIQRRLRAPVFQE
eukprot:9043899-Karenia_brevis.AAC.1